MDITRQAVNDMLKREKLNGSAVWSAAIHYNTNNSATCFSINRESYRWKEIAL